MSLFEPYDRRARESASSESADVRIRPAVPDDVARVAEIEATREGRPASSFISVLFMIELPSRRG